MLRRRAAYLTLTIAEFLRDQGLQGALPDGQRHPLRHGVARDLPRRRRGADQPRLSAGRVRRAAAAAGAGRARSRATAASPACSRCWSRATTPTSRSATRCAASWTGTSCSTGPIAERGRFPAVDVLRSISRSAPGCYGPDERALVREARRLMRLHADMAELIRLGAYRAGSDAELDRRDRGPPGARAPAGAGRGRAQHERGGLRRPRRGAGARADARRRLMRRAAGAAGPARAPCAGRASGWRWRRSTAELERRQAEIAALERRLEVEHAAGLRAAGRAAAAGGLRPARRWPRAARCAHAESRLSRRRVAETEGRLRERLRAWKALDAGGRPAARARGRRRDAGRAGQEVEEAARARGGR